MQPIYHLIFSLPLPLPLQFTSRLLALYRGGFCVYVWWWWWCCRTRLERWRLFFFFSRTDVLGSICKRWITRRRESIIQSGEKKNGNSGPMLGLRAPFSIWRHDFWKGGKRGVYVLYKGNGSTRKRRRWREGWRLERGRDGSQILSLAHFVSFLFLSFFFFQRRFRTGI